MELHTERLHLRRWRESDREPFIALNTDPEVMRHFVAPLTRAESESFIDRVEEGISIWGFGLWAVEVTATAEFVGFTGLWAPSFAAHFTPAIEVGWRLARAHWGKGYATEAASGALDYGFEQAGLAEIVSFTIPANTRSIAVMERLGMTHDSSDDFDHPGLPEGSPLRRHVLYRMSAQQWIWHQSQSGGQRSTRP